jgi:hypothetical protein
VYSIPIVPRDVPELLVERLDDVREPIQLRLGLVAAATHRYRGDGRVLIWQLDPLRRPFFEAVAVHVDGFENTFRQVFLDGRGQLRVEKVE